MNKTKIEWCDYTTNPVKGLCPMACSYCYARRMYKRYHWDETIRFEADYLVPQPCEGWRIFVGSTMELFGPWVKSEWLERIFAWVRANPQHTFIFLTKQPQRLSVWSPFPANCHVGVSCVDKIHFLAAMHHMANVSASVKFISFEPLLESMASTEPIEEHLQNGGISWVICGQQTPASAKTAPKVEWLREIVEAADKANVPVFLKNNLYDLLPTDPPFFLPDRMPDGSSAYTMRQELPRVAVGAAQ